MTKQKLRAVVFKILSFGREYGLERAHLLLGALIFDGRAKQQDTWLLELGLHETMGNILAKHESVDDSRFGLETTLTTVIIVGQFFDLYVGTYVHAVVVVFDIGSHEMHALIGQRQHNVEPIERQVLELQQLFEYLDVELFVRVCQ